MELEHASNINSKILHIWANILYYTNLYTQFLIKTIFDSQETGQSNLALESLGADMIQSGGRRNVRQRKQLIDECKPAAGVQFKIDDGGITENNGKLGTQYTVCTENMTLFSKLCFYV